MENQEKKSPEIIEEAPVKSEAAEKSVIIDEILAMVKDKPDLKEVVEGYADSVDEGKEHEFLFALGEREGENIFALRKKCSRLLSEILPLVPSEISAPYIGVDARTLYRWSEGAPYVPPASAVGVIISFAERVAHVKRFWNTFLMIWDKNLSNPDVDPVFFHPAMLHILKAEIPFDRKLKRLVKKTFFNLTALQNEKAEAAKES